MKKWDLLTFNKWLWKYVIKVIWWNLHRPIYIHQSNGPEIQLLNFWVFNISPEKLGFKTFIWCWCLYKTNKYNQQVLFFWGFLILVLNWYWKPENWKAEFLFYFNRSNISSSCLEFNLLALIMNDLCKASLSCTMGWNF